MAKYASFYYVYVPRSGVFKLLVEYLLCSITDLSEPEKTNHYVAIILTGALFHKFQEKATKWTENHEIDGLTTNGVLIMHPRGDFCGGDATCGPWRETSVGGAVFSLRESRSAQQKVSYLVQHLGVASWRHLRAMVGYFGKVDLHNKR